MNFSVITLEIHFNLTATKYSKDATIALALHKLSCYNSCIVSRTSNWLQSGEGTNLGCTIPFSELNNNEVGDQCNGPVLL